LRTLAKNLSVRAPQSRQGDLRKTERAREPHWAGLPVRFWRVGALVFQPDPLRIGHKVCHSEEWRRIVVWAARVPDLLAVGRTSAAKPIAILIRRTGFFALQGIPAGMASRAVGQPDLPSIPLQWRSGCIPAEPYPPLKQTQDARSVPCAQQANKTIN